jgi:Cys-rich protein (TIGR01571 family)
MQGQQHCAAMQPGSNQEPLILPVVAAAQYHPPTDANGLVVGRWKAGLCSSHGGGGCYPCAPNCAMAYFCPCVTIAQITSRIGLYRFSYVLCSCLILYLLTIGFLIGQYVAGTFSSSIACRPNVFGTTSCYVWYHYRTGGVWWILTFLFCSLSIALLTYVRLKVRSALFIPGNVFEDCLCTTFCSCCALAQMSTQVNAVDPGQCSFAPKDTLPGYYHDK